MGHMAAEAGQRRGKAAPSDDTRKRRLQSRLFWSPADLAGVGGLPGNPRARLRWSG